MTNPHQLLQLPSSFLDGAHVQGQAPGQAKFLGGLGGSTAGFRKRQGAPERPRGLPTVSWPRRESRSSPEGCVQEAALITH